MANRLSHSQTQRYLNCGESYRLHYIEKIRTTKSHSALLFGTALDKATGVLLDPKPTDRTPEETFEYFWMNQEVNGVAQKLPTLTSLAYAKTDWDEELLDKKDWSELLLDHGTDSESVCAIIKARNVSGFEALTPNEQVIANHAFWLCLKQKGLLMVDAFRKKVMPRLVNVLAVQKEINLQNDEGDSVIGFIDVIADVEGHGIVVLDVKTSARAYDEETSVIFSPQLSLYVHAVNEEYNTKKAGFIVLNKQVMKNRKKICKTCSYNGSGSRAKTCDQETIQTITNKKGVSEEKLTRCNGEWNESIDPQIYVQFIIEEIPEPTINLVIDNIGEINQAIKNNTYTKNLANCLSNFGRPCDFIGLCYKGSMENLTQVEKK